MIIKLKLIAVDEAEQSIVVRFYTDKMTEEMLANVWDDNGNILRCRTDMNVTFTDFKNRPKGVAVEEYLIRRFAPLQFLFMKENVADPAVDTSMTDLLPFIGVERTREIDVVDGEFVLKAKA